MIQLVTVKLIISFKLPSGSYEELLRNNDEFREKKRTEEAGLEKVIYAIFKSN